MFATHYFDVAVAFAFSIVVQPGVLLPLYSGVNLFLKTRLKETKDLNLLFPAEAKPFKRV